MDWREHVSRLKEDFDRDGYVLIEGFTSPAEATEVNAQVDRYVAEVLPGLPENAAFYEVKGNPETMLRLTDMAAHDHYFAELYHSERFAGLGAMLLGDEAVAINMQWFNKPARVGRETPPHQDGYYFMLEPNEALTLWLALDPVDQENGCVRYVPGSHRKGMRPHRSTEVLGFSQGISDYGEADRTAETSACVAPGDLIAHHCMTIHRADPNPSSRPRRALGFVYFARRARQDRERAEAYRKELAERWTREGKL